jgi:pimeloyl-ACP methyl ester carboxylesterase
MSTIPWLTAGLVLFAASAAPVIDDKGPQAKRPEAGSKGAEVLVGNWVGTLSVPPGFELQLVFRVARAEGKPAAATLDVPDQGAKGIPVDTLALDGDEATIGIKAIRGEFKGKRNEDGTAMVGKWTQGPITLPLTLKKVDVVPERRRPQMPKPPFPYKAEEVAYPSQADGVTLAGTLTLPEGQGPFPAVLLITGSGPQDRDESILGHKPFLVLADALTRRGIAVLRVDDRGFGRSTGNLATATTDDFADDVQGGVAFLRGRSEIDRKAIGLLGHSEGGIIAPIVAARAPGEVAFIVLLAGTGLPGAEIIRVQGIDTLKAAGADESTIALQRKAIAAILPIVMAETDPEALKAKLQAAMKPLIEELPEKDRKAMADAVSADALAGRLDNPWMRHFLAFDPRPTLARVKCSVLALNGELDTQVAYRPNLDEIARALKQGGNDQVTTRSFPKLNHLFQTCQTGAVSEYARIEETIAPEVLTVIGDWIKERTGPPRPAR